MARNFDIRCIPEALVGFRQNAQSVSSRNAEKQQLAGLYVQYLLLSELWELRPRPLAEVARTLLEFLRPSSLAAKDSLRQCNLHWANGRMLDGLGALALATWQSPRYVAERLRDEFANGVITNGVAPRHYLERKETLWS